MRIALITETFLPDVNGVVTTLCRLLEHLERAGHEALVVAPQGAPERYAGAEVLRLWGRPLPFYPELRLTPPQPGITAGLRRFKPDVVHLAGLVAQGPAGRMAARRLGVPLLSTYHTDWPAYTNHYGLGLLRPLVYRYLRWVHNSCLLTLCPSSTTLADLRTHGFRRLKLWGRGVDTALFHPRRRAEGWRSTLGARPDELVLLYVGRLAAEKRLDVLVEAVTGLEGVRLVLVGDGPERVALERKLAGAPATFAGFLRGEALAEAYASADMFVLPSDTETFGQVIQEAMASQLSVVAARAGGAPDLIRHGENGLLFTPGDAADLRIQLQRLVADAGERARLGQAARAAAELRSWPRVLDELLAHYQHISRRWGRPRLQAWQRLARI